MQAAKSVLGAVMAALYLAAFAGAYYLYRSGAGAWPDSQWLFLVALPYTAAMLRIAGSVDFSGDALLGVAIACAFGCALAYFAGALAEAILRGALGLARSFIGRA